MATEFQQQAIALAKQQSVLGWLTTAREQGQEAWQSHSWPTRKTEAWRYTSLLPVENEQWQLSDTVTDSVPQNALGELIEMDAYRLVFVNGQLNADLSSDLPANVVSFANADAAQQQLIRSTPS